jgi:GTPase SAR1 family protein
VLCLLKAHKPSAAQRVTVSVVGFSNAGKSSLINTLKRAKVRYHVRFELGMFVIPLLTVRRHVVRRCSAAQIHERTAVCST